MSAEVTSTLLTALVGLLGVGAGFVLQRLGQHRTFLSDSRYEAYILFLRSLSGSGATKPDSEARWAAVAGMIEAKSRIALFGSKEVVQALSDYSAKHRRVENDNFDELARIISLMRNDVGADRIPDLEKHLRGLLFDVGN